MGLIKYIFGGALLIMILSYLFRVAVVAVVFTVPALAQDDGDDALKAIAAEVDAEDQAQPQTAPATPPAGLTPRPSAKSIPVSQLRRVSESPAAAAVTPSAPTVPSPTAVPVMSSPTTAESPTAVLSEELPPQTRTAAEVAGAGVLGVAQAGFSADLWAGLDRTQADRRLTRLKSDTLRSGTARRLLQRALLTAATPPEGAAKDSWLAVRVDALHAMGVADAAAALVAPYKEAELAALGLERPWVESKLLGGEVGPACGFVKTFILNSDAPFWRQALLVCHALAKDTDALRVSLDVATESDRRLDPLLFGLLDAGQEGGPSPRLKPDTVLTPLQAALYAAYPALVAPDVITRLPDRVLRGLVGRAALPLSLRLQAAEKLVNDFGTAPDVDTLVKLYESARFTDETLAAPLKYVQNEADGSLARALLWQASGVANLPSGKALVLKVLWERAEADGLIDLPASLTPDRRGLVPEVNLAWFSPFVARAALRSGNLPVAKAWTQPMSQNRNLSRELVQARADLTLMFGLLEGQLAPDVLTAWWQTQNLSTPQGMQKALRVLTLLEAMDMPVPTDLWADLHTRLNDVVDRTAGPGPVWLRLLGSSLEAGHVGDAVLLIAEPTLHRHPAALAPQGVANMVSGLRFLGLKNDAASLALESLLQGDKAAF